MGCEANVGLSGVNPSVYLPSDTELADIFLHLGGTPDACTWPIPASHGGFNYAGPTTASWTLAYRPTYGNDAPGDEAITSVNFVAYGGVDGGATIDVKIFVIIDGTRYDLATVSGTNDPSFLQYSSGLLFVRPSDSAAWTKANIVAAKWGLEVTGPFSLRGIFLEVYWTSPGTGGFAVNSITPDNGPAAGSTDVIITGVGLTGATAVTFGAVAAASFNVDSGSQISAVTPAHASGAVDVHVTVP